MPPRFTRRRHPQIPKNLLLSFAVRFRCCGMRRLPALILCPHLSVLLALNSSDHPLPVSGVFGVIDWLSACVHDLDSRLGFQNPRWPTVQRFNLRRIRHRPAGEREQRPPALEILTGSGSDQGRVHSSSTMPCWSFKARSPACASARAASIDKYIQRPFQPSLPESCPQWSGFRGYSPNSQPTVTLRAFAIATAS